MVIVYSATKGLAAMTFAIAHSRGWLDYEERVCAYSQFAQQGKITVRQLLAHQAGLFALDQPMRSESPRQPGIDLRWCWRGRNRPGSLGRGRPITPSHLASTRGEILRRIDPRHRSLGEFFQDEESRRLWGWTSISGCRIDLPNSRLATHRGRPERSRSSGFSALDSCWKPLNRRSNITRADGEGAPVATR